MAELERKKGKMSKNLIIWLVAMGLILAGNSLSIISWINKYIVHNSKEESTVTKILTVHDMSEMVLKQIELSKEYSESKTQYWLSREIHDGNDSIWAISYYVMDDHPEYDSAKVELTITKYKVNGKTVEFVSKSKVIQVHSNNGWENK